MHNQQQLIVFARAPEYGLVKRRLAADIGKQQALDFYTKTLKTLLEQMDGGHWHLTVATDTCLLYTSPSPRDKRQARMPSSA